MIYKQIKYLSIISIVLGILISYLLLSMTYSCGFTIDIHIDEIGYHVSRYIDLPELQAVLFYNMVLTIVLMIIVPILILRSRNPKKIKNLS